jgi:hypothetical protein
MVKAISVSPDDSEFAYSFSDPRVPSSGIALAHQAGSISRNFTGRSKDQEV